MSLLAIVSRSPPHTTKRCKLAWRMKHSMLEGSAAERCLAPLRKCSLPAKFQSSSGQPSTPPCFVLNAERCTLNAHSDTGLSFVCPPLHSVAASVRPPQPLCDVAHLQSHLSAVTILVSTLSSSPACVRPLTQSLPPRHLSARPFPLSSTTLSASSRASSLQRWRLAT